MVDVGVVEGSAVVAFALVASVVDDWSAADDADLQLLL
jgi:hypothetical protein